MARARARVLLSSGRRGALGRGARARARARRGLCRGRVSPGCRYLCVSREEKARQAAERVLLPRRALESRSMLPGVSSRSLSSLGWAAARRCDPCPSWLPHEWSRPQVTLGRGPPLAIRRGGVHPARGVEERACAWPGRSPDSGPHRQRRLRPRDGEPKVNGFPSHVS